MAGTAGKSFLLKASTTAGGAGSYTTVADLNNGSLSINGEMIDISVFAATWKAIIQGLKSAAFSWSGFRNASDTTGQIAIQNALINDSELWLQFLPDGSTGFKCQVKPGNITIGAEVNGAVATSGSAESTGAIATV